MKSKSMDANAIEVAVIGGGLAGLSAAAYLARSGRKVVLFDKGARVGGRAISELKEGAWCNLGAHALYKGGAAFETFQELGLKIQGNKPSTSGVHLWLGGQNHSLVSFFFRMLNWSARKEFISFFRKINKADPLSLHYISVLEWAQSQFRTPVVQSFALAMFRLSTYHSNPAQLRADAAMRQVRLVNQGILYVDGGWQTLVDELKEKVVEFGGVIEEGNQVEEIVCDNGRVQSIRLARGERFDISAAIIATGPNEASQLLKQNKAAQSLMTWSEQSIPIYASCLDLVLNRIPNPKIGFTLGIDVPIYFSNHSASAKLSDNGTSVVHLLKYHASGKSMDATKDRGELEHFMDTLQPGWRNDVAFSRFLPHIPVCYGFPQVNGKLDPQTSVPEVKGLYVAGDWIHAKGMLADAAVGSGKQAAGLALGYLLEKPISEVIDHGTGRTVSHL